MGLTHALAANEAAESVHVVRVLEANEIVEAAAPPVVDISTGDLRIKCVAVNDKASGYATVSSGGSSMASLLLRPATPEEAGGDATNGKGKGKRKWQEYAEQNGKRQKGAKGKGKW